MTGANRLPSQHSTKGLRCQCVLTPAEAARSGIQTTFSATTRLFEPVAGRKSACGDSNSTAEVIVVLEWPGGGVGRGSNGKCRLTLETIGIFV